MYKNEAFCLGESFHSLAQKAVPEDVFDDDGRLFVPYVVNFGHADYKEFCATVKEMFDSHGKEGGTTEDGTDDSSM